MTKFQFITLCGNFVHNQHSKLNREQVLILKNVIESFSTLKAFKRL